MRLSSPNILTTALLSIVGIGCTSDLTQLVILLTSDYEQELHRIGVDIEDQNGQLISTKNFEIAEQNMTLPLSFTVEPGSTYKDFQIRIIVLAINKAQTILAERSVQIGFIDQQRRLLRLELLRSCRPIVCDDAEQSCIDGKCLDDFVDIRNLPVVNPGEEFGIDASDHVTNSDAETSDADNSNVDADASIGEQDTGGMGTTLTNPNSSCQTTGCPNHQLCVNTAQNTLCDGNDSSGANCKCRLACDPFGAVLRCGLSSDICTYIEDASPEGQGYCIPNLGGGEQGDVCSAFFNSKGEKTGDNCDRTKNFVCSGVSAIAPDGGQCARVCRTDLFLNCQFLLSETTYECHSLSSDQTSILGTCRLPPQDLTDISNACLSDLICQSQSCLSPWTSNNGICTAECGGLNTCPIESLCFPISVNSETQRLCFKDCETDIECTMKNRSNVCHPIGDRKICYPRCDRADNQCPGSQGACNLRTGHCE